MAGSRISKVLNIIKNFDVIASGKFSHFLCFIRGWETSVNTWENCMCLCKFICKTPCWRDGRSNILNTLVRMAGQPLVRKPPVNSILLQNFFLSTFFLVIFLPLLYCFPSLTTPLLMVLKACVFFGHITKTHNVCTSQRNMKLCKVLVEKLSLQLFQCVWDFR